MNDCSIFSPPSLQVKFILITELPPLPNSIPIHGKAPLTQILLKSTLHKPKSCNEFFLTCSSWDAPQFLLLCLYLTVRTNKLNSFDSRCVPGGLYCGDKLWGRTKEAMIHLQLFQQVTDSIFLNQRKNRIQQSWAPTGNPRREEPTQGGKTEI